LCTKLGVAVSVQELLSHCWFCKKNKRVLNYKKGIKELIEKWNGAERMRGWNGTERMMNGKAALWRPRKHTCFLAVSWLANGIGFPLSLSLSCIYINS